MPATGQSAVAREVASTPAAPPAPLPHGRPASIGQGLPFKDARRGTEEGLGKHGRMASLVLSPLPLRPSLPADRPWKGGREHGIAESRGLGAGRGRLATGLANTPRFIRGQRGKKDAEANERARAARDGWMKTLPLTFARDDSCSLALSNCPCPMPSKLCGTSQGEKN